MCIWLKLLSHWAVLGLTTNISSTISIIDEKALPRLQMEETNINLKKKEKKISLDKTPKTLKLDAYLY
jgi:hypothetical protein